MFGHLILQQAQVTRGGAMLTGALESPLSTSWVRALAESSTLHQDTEIMDFGNSYVRMCVFMFVQCMPRRHTQSVFCNVAAWEFSSSALLCIQCWWWVWIEKICRIIPEPSQIQTFPLNTRKCLSEKKLPISPPALIGKIFIHENLCCINDYGLYHIGENTVR